MEAMAYQVEEAQFRYAVAHVLRDSHQRKADELARTPMEDRTVAMLEQLAHHKAEVRAQERVMNDCVMRAEALEAQALLATEEHNDGTPTEDAAPSPDS